MPTVPPKITGNLAVTGSCTGCGFTEGTVSTNQTVAAANCGTYYVATAALTTSCMFKVNALGGAVTLTPNAADQFNSQVAATGVGLPQGAASEIVTDANGNFYATNLTFGKITDPADAWPGTPNAADDEFYKGSASTRRAPGAPGLPHGGRPSTASTFPIRSPTASSL